MPYAVPEPKRSKGQDVFEFGPASAPSKFKVKRFKFLPMGTVEALSEAKGDDYFAIMLAMFGSKDSAAGKFVRGLEADQFLDLFKAYQEDSGTDMGESEAS